MTESALCQYVDRETRTSRSFLLPLLRNPEPLRSMNCPPSFAIATVTGSARVKRQSVRKYQSTILHEIGTSVCYSCEMRYAGVLIQRRMWSDQNGCLRRFKASEAIGSRETYGRHSLVRLTDQGRPLKVRLALTGRDGAYQWSIRQTLELSFRCPISVWLLHVELMTSKCVCISKR